MKRPKQFPRWVQWTIEAVAVFLGALYILGGILRWISQLSGLPM